MGSTAAGPGSEHAARSRSFGSGLAALVGTVLWVGCPPERVPPPPESLIYEELDVGLSAEERKRLRFLTEGSDLFPLDLLRALEDRGSGRLFIDSMDRYGFIPAAESPHNPYGLPIGWTTDVPELSPNELPYVGVNCSACHTGRIDYRGHRMVIDGAPNMADIEEFGRAVRDSLLQTLQDPGEALELVNRLAQLRHPDEGFAAVFRISEDTREFLKNLEAAAEEEAGTVDRSLSELETALEELVSDLGGEEEGVLAIEESEGQLDPHLTAALGVLAKYAPIVIDRATFALRALHAIETSPPAGPGRDDPWGLVRNVLFEEATPLTAPTSIPHLFYFAQFDWYHADGNTTSVIQRDVTQAVALGAYVDTDTGESTLLPRNMHELELLWGKVTSPAWPEEVFGPIDRELAERGAEIFSRRIPGADGGEWSCDGCHRSRKSTMFDHQLIGTDPNRAVSFAQPLAGEVFSDQIPLALADIIETAYERSGITPEEASQIEPSTPRWRTTGKYVARTLDGVWATAPYLHNGSVPDLHSLLLPPAERPVSFPLGHREYDPERVGYSTEVEVGGFVLDTTVDGNSNAGHDYGTTLDEEDRRALIEYLKTL